MERITECLVKIWNMDVGVLSWDSRRNFARFQYTPDFCNTNLEISPLMMPLDPNKVYEFPELRFDNTSDTFCGLPGIFADSLPEKYGNTLMKKWLEKHNIDFKSLNPIERLCYVGTRGMGALEYEPTIDYFNKKDEELIFDDLVEVARKIMLEEEDKSKILTENDNLAEQLIRIGTSAGGAKAKALIALKLKDGKPVGIYSGQAAPREDLSYWLVKFSDVKNDEHKSDLFTGRLEYAYYLMAKSCGIKMMESRILNDKNKVGHFITRRFDRIKTTKLHTATFCGIAHEDRNPVGMTSYEKLFETARALKLDNTRLEQLYRRMVFNIIARNQDDHSKNHSFIMTPDGKWDITPAYDICFSYNKKSIWIEKQQMNCNGKRDNFTYTDLIQVAKKADINNPKKIIKEVNESVDNWLYFAEKAGLPEVNSKLIKDNFRIIKEPTKPSPSPKSKADADGISGRA